MCSHFVVKRRGADKACEPRGNWTCRRIAKPLSALRFLAFGMRDEKSQPEKTNSPTWHTRRGSQSPASPAAVCGVCELALGLRLVVRSKVTPRLAPPGPCLERPAAALAPRRADGSGPGRTGWGQGGSAGSSQLPGCSLFSPPRSPPLTESLKRSVATERGQGCGTSGGR